jgi:preprotein translocase subunit SecG
MYFMVVVNVISTIGMVAGILMHSGKGGGLSDMFGGGSGAGIGSAAAERNLNRITFVIALVWVVSILRLVHRYLGVPRRSGGIGRRASLRG